MPKTLFHNCRLNRPLVDEKTIENAWLLVENGRIAKVGHGNKPRADESVDLDGQRVLPGLINAHTHLYSALSGRMPWPAQRPSSFTEILKKIWWRLDRGLDERSLRISARLGLVESIRRGTTTLIDHHSSPGIEEGALAIIAEEAEKLGIKVAVSCELTDRNGEESLEDAMDENLRALQIYSEHETIRGIYGMHASFTLSEESVDRALEVLPPETAFHIHCAESQADLDHAKREGYESVIDRLAVIGVLRRGTILAHCVHLMPHDAEMICEMGAYVVHCPQSNAYNQVGTARVGDMLGCGARVGLGTDGFLTSMLTEAQFARDTGVDNGTLIPAKVGELLFAGNAGIASSVFGRAIGWLKEGEEADFIVQRAEGGVLDPKAKITRVVSRGRSVCVDGEVQGVDREQLYAEAEKEAARLWARMPEA